VLAQVFFAALLAVIVYALYRNMVSSLERQGVVTSFRFLSQTASFDIGEQLIPFSRNDTYARAFLVGLLNTLLVSLLGIIVATLLGIVIGVARLSGNLLVNRLAALYIEAFRNIPLLVFLIFWYTGVFLKLPKVKDAIVLPGPTFISNRGVAIPWGIPTDTYHLYLWILGGGLLAAVALTWWMARQGRRTGRTPLIGFWAPLTFLGIAALGWIILPQAPLTPDLPLVKGLNTTGGMRMTPEFAALVSGLALYTAAFIAEVVRAGIQAVSKGQVEAARALGLNSFQVLRLVVFPQAMRVIIPPLTSQYLNLTKNSSLAAAVGYSDLYSISGTIYNNTGRAVEATIIIMGIYLLISLLTSLFMNWYNKKVRLVER
jgi:general L-amino acid transport system permease protein